ncbi:hypothetical protein LBMAG26_12780 [Bacteroidota bacterium]|jgi:hypothetical protein|nr:hypothetical protein LBMAG26_12780 [Bacteroidota bacterium]
MPWPGVVKPESRLISWKLYAESDELDILIFVESIDCEYTIIEWVHTKNRINMRLAVLVNMNTIKYLKNNFYETM